MANLSHWRWRSKRLLTETAAILTMLLSIAVAMGGTSCRKSSSDLNGADKNSSTAADSYPLHLEPFVVNLADTDGNRFLRVGIDLELEKPFSTKDGEPSTARIRDSVIFVLSTWQSNALLASDGKQKLKDEVLRALQDRVPELRVREVYFTEFLVQR